MGTRRTISDVVVRLCALCFFMLGLVTFAEDARGFRFNNLTVSPYVNLEYSYDSNVSYDSAGGSSDSILTVTPGVDVTYNGNGWGLSGNAWYGYDKYMQNDLLTADRYGENLKFYQESAKGLRLVVQQKYLKSAQNDSIIEGGRGLWRDREQFDLNGALSYQMGERTGLTLSAMYSDLSYANDASQYAPLYGWQEWSAGLEVARKLTEKSNVLVSGAYQEYTSDGTSGSGISSTSTGYSLQAGLGSRATDKISYHALTGISMFDYGNSDQLMGWTYTLDANWVLSRKLALTVSGSSYYQPSETEVNQAMKVYALSTGLIYRPARKLTGMFDIAYRREENEYSGGSGEAMTQDMGSARVRADYQVSRFVSVYGGLEYEERLSNADAQEFDRYRGTIGLSLRY